MRKTLLCRIHSRSVRGRASDRTFLLSTMYKRNMRIPFTVTAGAATDDAKSGFARHLPGNSTARC
jgi:hypothetical protein